MKKNLLLLLILFLAYNGFAQSIGSFQNVNPAFIKYQEALASGKIIRQTVDGYSLGYIPPPVKPNFSNYKRISELKSGKGFPSIYDLRTIGYVSPVKNQGQCGDCWAFASYGSVESNWIKNGYGTFDLSENNLNNCSGFEWQPCDGGNSILSTSYMSRLSGPVSETSDPYVDAPGNCITGLTPVAYVWDARFLPADMNTIKQAVTDYGALYTTFFWSNGNYDSGSHTYYGSDSTQSPNHAVTIVGWDDTIVTAGGTGAWIIKNSWGTGWGESGYFYMSYNDATVLNENACFPVRLDYKLSSRVYYYDDLGWVTDWGYNNETAYAIVKFMTSDNNPLYKIGTWINTAEATVDISVYSGFDGTSLSGLLGTIPTQTCQFPGYYTFDLPSAINLNSGTAFYVKVKYYTPGSNLPIPVEAFQPGYANPTIETGKCWSSSDGKTWDALGKNTKHTFDLCIKAYSYNNCTPPQANITVNGSANLCENQSVLLTANTGNQLTYQWLQNNMIVNGATNSSLTVSSSGDYSVVVTDNTGCPKGSPDVNIYNYTLNAGSDAYINCGDSVHLSPVLNYPTGNFIKLFAPVTKVFSNIGFADFGADYRSGYVSGNVVYQKDNSGNYDGCSSTGYTKGSFFNKIALIDRSLCDFSAKAYAAQLAGAKAVIIVNNQPGGGVTTMGAGSNGSLVNIPVVMISYEAGDTIKQTIADSGYAEASIGFDAKKLKFSWSPAYGLNATDILNPFANPRISKTYTLTVSADNCTLTDKVSINIINTVKVNLGKDTSIYNNQDINLNAGSGFKSYLWNDNSTAQNLLVKGSAVPLGAHIYSVTVTDNSGCMGTGSIEITILAFGHNVIGNVIYDNSISSPMKNAKVYLTDLENNVIKIASADSTGSFQISGIQNGTYKLYATTSAKWGGLEPTDALLINSYFVKLTKFKDDLTAKAADVLANNFISPIDAMAILKRFVRITTSFKSGDWLSDNPTITINNYNLHLNIRMICAGDVNASYKP